jgi:hypothetical protein
MAFDRPRTLGRAQCSGFVLWYGAIPAAGIQGNCWCRVAGAYSHSDLSGDIVASTLLDFSCARKRTSDYVYLTQYRTKHAVSIDAGQFLAGTVPKHG